MDGYENTEAEKWAAYMEQISRLNEKTLHKINDSKHPESREHEMYMAVIDTVDALKECVGPRVFAMAQPHMMEDTNHEQAQELKVVSQKIETTRKKKKR